jgi:hypothetical protein
VCNVDQVSSIIIKYVGHVDIQPSNQSFSLAQVCNFTSGYPPMEQDVEGGSSREAQISFPVTSLVNTIL